MSSIKAIETVYNGYRFRSRLEARWAVFYDTLGITYDYEPDGFDLDGTRYLPDFRIHELDCWIEIKGQEATREELNKACLLSLHDNRRVYIFAGAIRIPDIEDHFFTDKSTDYASERNGLLFDPEDMSISGDNPATSCHYDHKGICAEHGDDCPDLFETWDHKLASALYREELFSLYFDSFKLRLTKDKHLQFLIPVYEDEDHHKYLGRAPIPLPAIVKQYEHEFIKLLASKPVMWEWGIGNIFPLFGEGGQVWAQCTDCRRIKIVRKGCKSTVLTDGCPCGGIFVHDSPRLNAAYTAARQARFEHGEKGIRP